MDRIFWCLIARDFGTGITVQLITASKKDWPCLTFLPVNMQHVVDFANSRPCKNGDSCKEGRQQDHLGESQNVIRKSICLQNQKPEPKKPDTEHMSTFCRRVHYRLWRLFYTCGDTRRLFINRTILLFIHSKLQ